MRLFYKQLMPFAEEDLPIATILKTLIGYYPELNELEQREQLSRIMVGIYQSWFARLYVMLQSEQGKQTLDQNEILSKLKLPDAIKAKHANKLDAYLTIGIDMVVLPPILQTVNELLGLLKKRHPNYKTLLKPKGTQVSPLVSLFSNLKSTNLTKAVELQRKLDPEVQKKSSDCTQEDLKHIKVKDKSFQMRHQFFNPEDLKREFATITDSMQHIGIVSVTTVGACLCANRIVANAALLNKSGKHPEFTLHTLSFDRYKTAINNQDWLGFADIILSSISTLKKAGADFIIIPANTPHFGIDKIKKESPLPVLSMLDIVVKKCVDLKLKRVGILGTKFTMEGGLYDLLLESKGISPVIPDKITRGMIHALIMDEIIPSQIKQCSVDAVIERLKPLDCEAMVLGCTELPEVLNEDNLNIRVLDTTHLMAEAALQYAMASKIDSACKKDDFESLSI